MPTPDRPAQAIRDGRTVPTALIFPFALSRLPPLVRVACALPAPFPSFSDSLAGWRSRERGGRPSVDTSFSSSRERLAHVWRYAAGFVTDLSG
jgi:hypothetical protein